MQNFVELWVYLSSAPLFGLTATLAVYVLAQAVSLRAGHAPWANPVMLSVAVLAGVLLATGTAYPTYFAGAQFIHLSHCGRYGQHGRYLRICDRSRQERGRSRP